MSASEGRRRRWTVRIRVYCLLVAMAAGLGAQEPKPPSPSEPFPLSGSTRGVLARLQMDWLEWLVACNEGDSERTEAALESLRSHTRLLGMKRVPALSAAASLRAIEFAEAGDIQRAQLGLVAAETLDPQRPEGAFAAARVARLSGDWLGLVTSYARGWYRSLWAPQLRYLLLQNLGTWLFGVLTLSGLLLVGVLMMARGQALYFDLFRFFHRYTPRAASHLLCLVVLCWPLLLPAGTVWTAFFWTVLLFGYGGRLERVLLVVVWLIVGSLPALLSEQSRRVGLELFEPLQSLESAARGELEGELFNHLSVLQSILPESLALEHLRADIHRRLRQMENARTGYRWVLGAEPGNQSVLNDLGIYYFDASDFDQAADYFSRAAEADEPRAEVAFNLSQAYSELYKFTESEAALLDARALDSDSVNVWLQAEAGERVVALDGGLGRVDEIRSELRAQWRVGEELPTWFGHWLRALSLPLVLVLIVIGTLIRMVIRRGRSVKLASEWWGPRADRLRKALLTGVPEAEEGHSARAAVAVVILVALATLPVSSMLGYRLPWLHEPPPILLPALSGLGLVVFFALRFVRYGRSRQ